VEQSVLDSNDGTSKAPSTDRRPEVATFSHDCGFARLSDSSSNTARVIEHIPMMCHPDFEIGNAVTIQPAPDSIPLQGEDHRRLGAGLAHGPGQFARHDLGASELSSEYDQSDLQNRQRLLERESRVPIMGRP
jgi:hypothetical protein